MTLDRSPTRRLVLFGGGVALTFPFAARAQQQKPMPVIGYLHTFSPGFNTPYLAAFHEGLSDTGYINGRNVAIEHRWAEGQSDRLPELAADLVGRNVDVIVTNGATLRHAQ